jgi:hypothetical protein
VFLVFQLLERNLKQQHAGRHIARKPDHFEGGILEQTYIEGHI